MKRLFVILLSLVLLSVMASALFACAKEENGTAISGENVGTPAEKAQSDSGTGEPAGDEGAGSDQAPAGEEGNGSAGDPAGDGGEGAGGDVYVPVITNVLTLISAHSDAAQTFGADIASSLLREYTITDPIYCGYSFAEANSDAEISAMTVSVATKTDYTARKYATYTITFDPVKLDDIADGTYSLSNTKSGLASQQTYNAQEKQNDADFLDSLYNQDDFTYVAYENETFQNPTQDVTIQELLANHSDAINANLSTHYDNVLKRAFKADYNKNKDKVTSYQWDLGDVNANNEIQNSKLTFAFEKDNSISLYVYDVNFASPININNLKDTNLSSVSATYTQEYAFGYDTTIQGTRADLVNAILNKAITDDFDYQNAEIMFKVLSSATDADLGTTRNFTVVTKNDSGIREITITIKTASDDTSLITNIQNGKFKINNSQKSIQYSSNLVTEYAVSETEMSR